MPSPTEAQQALIRRIIATPGAPSIVRPNTAVVTGLPRWIVQVGAMAQRPRTVAGLTEGTAEIVVRVETADGAETGGPDGSDALVQRLLDRFPVMLEVDGVRIVTAPLPRPPLTGDGIYAVPVIIRGRFYF